MLSKKEIKKLKKDAEKERKKRTSDPFYLGAKAADQSGEGVLLVDEEEVESIPIFNLSDEEDGKKKKKKKKKKLDSDDDDSALGSVPKPQTPNPRPQTPDPRP